MEPWRVSKTPEKKLRYIKQWKAANRDRVNGYSRESRKARIALLAAEKNKPCADCGKRYPHYVMDFDHVRGRKLFTISHYITVTLARLLREIAKCDVVCANCHREREARRRTNE
jgi:hypothetical protein